MSGDEIEQDVNSESSAPETSSPSPENNPPAAEAQPQTEQHQKTVPYDRFQEVVKSRQEYEQKIQAYDERMARMERDFQEQLARFQQPKPAKQEAALIAKMREIDPAYAEYLEGLESKSGKVDAIEQELQQFKLQNMRNQYESMINGYHEQYKTPESVRGFVRQLLDSQAKSGDLKSLDQVEKAYKATAAQFTQFLESTKRETTKSYVKDKSRDASAPASQPKGVAASAKKAQQFTDSEDLKSDVVKSGLAKWKAERDI